MNPSIEELYRKEEISTSTFIVCKHSDLKTVNDLLEHLKEHNTFENLKVSNSNSNIELIEICWKYTNKNIEERIEKDVNISNNSIESYKEKNTQKVEDNSNEKRYANIGLEELSNREKLSVRTYNICENNDLLDLYNILLFFSKNGTFINLRNCGRRSNLELTKLCAKYNTSNIESQTSLDITNNESHVVSKINDLDIRQEAIVNSTINNYYLQLSRRSQNIIDKLLNNSITLDGLKNKIFLKKNFNIINVKNAGRKSEMEIINFLKKIKAEIEREAGIKYPDELRKVSYEVILINHFDVDKKILSDIKNNYDLSLGIPIFKIINLLISENYIFKEKQKVVFNNSIGFFDSQEIETLEKTGIKIGVTRERARQIREKILENFSRYFSFVELFNKEKVNLYGIDTTASFLYFDDKLISDIRTVEGVNYNKRFVNLIFSLILKEEYGLIGNDDTLNGKKRKNKHKWKSTCLISKSLLAIYNFEKMINDFSISILTLVKKKDSTIFLGDFISNYFKAEITQVKPEINHTAEQLLLCEFGDEIKIENGVIYKKKVKKSRSEIIAEILNVCKTPMHYQEIYNECKRKKIKATSAASIHSTLTSHPEVFGLKGAGTYGLLEWGGYFGSIGDVTEKKLRELNEPIAMKKLEGFLVRELYISQDSIREVLLNYKGEIRFIKLKNGKISLKEWL